MYLTSISGPDSPDLPSVPWEISEVLSDPDTVQPHQTHVAIIWMVADKDGNVVAGTHQKAFVFRSDDGSVEMCPLSTAPLLFRMQPSETQEAAGLCLTRDGGRQPTDDELILGALSKAASRAETGGVMSAEERKAMKLPVREMTAADRAYAARCRAIIARMKAKPITGIP